MSDHAQKTKSRAFVSTLAIMGSRVLGLVREQVLAFFFGAGAVLDAFFVAFRIPNLMRDLAAEGALSQSFVAIFSQKLTKEDKKEAFQLAHKTTTFIILFMGVLVILGEIFAPQIVSAVAVGFEGEKYLLTVRLLRILFPYILFVSVSALMMGMLHSLGKFFIPHSASTFFNFTSISFGLLFAYWLSPDYMSLTWQKISHGSTLDSLDFLASANAIAGMAMGTLVGGLAQYAFQIPTALKEGFIPKLNFNLKDPGLIKVLQLTAPAIVGGAAVQVNVLINTEFASLLVDGSVSYLNYAFRFMQFPLGVFGVAIATASAPALAQMVTQKKTQDFKKTIRSALQMSLFLCVPSTIGLMVIGQDIIALIYQHGHFSPSDTLQTAYALTAYSLGITSYALIKIYQPAFLAFHNAKTPMRIALFSMFINGGINAYFILVLNLSHWALALGTAIVALVNIILLAFAFRKHIPQIWNQEIWLHLLKVVLASVIMGALLWFMREPLYNTFSAKHLGHRALRVFIPMLLALPVYALSTWVMGVQDTKFLLRKLKR